MSPFDLYEEKKMTTVQVTKTVKLDENTLRKLVGAPSGAIITIEGNSVTVTWQTWESVQQQPSYSYGDWRDR